MATTTSSSFPFVGRSTAFGDIHFRTCHAALRSYAASFAVPGMDGDDLFAEAVLRVLKRPSQDGISDLLGYLRMTIRNVAIEKATRTRPVMFSCDLELWNKSGADVELAATLFSPRMQKAFSGLPDRWQKLLFRLLIADEPPAEIAHDLGLSPTAFRSLAHRARTGLRDAYVAGGRSELPAARSRTPPVKESAPEAVRLAKSA